MVQHSILWKKRFVQISETIHGCINKIKCTAERMKKNRLQHFIGSQWRHSETDQNHFHFISFLC